MHYRKTGGGFHQQEMSESNGKDVPPDEQVGAWGARPLKSLNFAVNNAHYSLLIFMVHSHTRWDGMGWAALVT